MRSNHWTTRHAGYRYAAAVGALTLGLVAMPSTGNAQQNAQSAAMQKQVCAAIMSAFKGIKMGGGGGGQIVLQMGGGGGKPVFSDSGKAKPSADTAAAKPTVAVVADTTSKHAAHGTDTTSSQAQASKTDSTAKAASAAAKSGQFTCSTTP